MRSFHPRSNNRLRAALAASVRRGGEMLYLGWALTSLGFCGLLAVALL